MAGLGALTAKMRNSWARSGMLRASLESPVELRRV